MKKFGLILAGCLAFIGICGAHAEDIGDVARAAVRRASTSATVSNRQKTANTTSRTNTTTAHTTQTVHNRATTTPTRTSNVAERSTAARTAGNVVPRTTSEQQSPTVSGRTATRTATTNSLKSRTVSRTTTTDTVTREDILSRDYSKCKKVFFDCMDEFCANKDAQLKRCACSSRINEFDSIKKQLADVEDKMLDFNQRLLTVSMDKEDAAALSVATEGEQAYLGTTDKSDSKKTLDAIAKKLNTSFDSSRFNTDLNVLSWSLNEDTAFDNVDSLMGASTTTKSGTALFSAALPICREMAAEVCSDTDAKLAESGYLAAIEQDCNTVAKTYQTQAEQARTKILEGSALLDMSRLDVYQKRNSDDILTCKKKMLDMLTNSTVCGDELGKCLDITGQYIDPSTGEVFLTPNLVDIDNLLTSPTENYTWSTVPSNSTFVQFLNSKRKFLEPAMEQCENIADNAWNSFIDDALAQIKLAQGKKLEEVRQSCTALTAQCLSDASESITNFDARALSTFGVSADITANAMCENVLNSCSVLLAETGGSEWTTGMSEIMTTNSYDALMQTCRQVGRACIIQVCSSTSGNFGLCESISNSTNRKAIINHTACWDEVKECVRSAGEENINKIITQLGADTGMNLNFYSEMYDSTNFNANNIILSGSDNDSVQACITTVDDSDPENPQTVESQCVYDICQNECASTSTRFECRVCRLSEKLWGNCEVSPTKQLESKNMHNRIKLPRDTNTPTLLYWFAMNTGTSTADDSCRDTTCGIGYVPTTNAYGLVECVSQSSMCYTNYHDRTLNACPASKIQTTSSNYTNCQCCSVTDLSGNCCESGFTITNELYGQTYCVASGSGSPNGTGTIITNEYSQPASEGWTTLKHTLVCDGGVMTERDGHPHCDRGTLVIAMKYNKRKLTQQYIGASRTSTTALHYYSPTNTNYITESFMSPNGQCNATYIPDTNTWTWSSGGTECGTPSHWSIVHGN